jgi:hypothetical protein
VALALAVAWAVANLGALFDGRPWAIPSELARLAATWAALVVATVGLEPTAVAAVAGGGALAAG